MDDDAELLSALDDLVAEIEQNVARNRQLVRRAREIKRERARGVPWRDIVSEDRRPLIVELLTQNAAVLNAVGSRVRRLEARALHAEGLSMERIAALFGVTRQRISQLLHNPADDAPQ